jgi:hypothetical protein
VTSAAWSEFINMSQALAYTPVRGEVLIWA